MKDTIVIKMKGRTIKTLVNQMVYGIYIDSNRDYKGRIKDGREVVKEGENWVLDLSKGEKI